MTPVWQPSLWGAVAELSASALEPIGPQCRDADGKKEVHPPWPHTQRSADDDDEYEREDQRRETKANDDG